MFGFTKLTPEEIAERDRKLRITELDKLLKKETHVRIESLKRSEIYRNEYEVLTTEDKA